MAASNESMDTSAAVRPDRQKTRLRAALKRMAGTCTNFGCDAKILSDGPFEFMDGLKRYEGLCVETDVKID